MSPGLPSPITNVCPLEQVCADTRAICALPSATHVADCPPPLQCGICTADRRYACLNATTFAYCFGNPFPSPVTDNCPLGSFCDVMATPPAFCTLDSSVS